MLSIALIDIIGLTYDGNTLSKRGLGGSESAIILMSKELAALGFDVTVFNNCIDREAAEGTYDNVKYIDISKLDTNKDYNFDIVISSRTVIPFLPKQTWHFFQDLKPERFEKIKENSKFRAVWMHDTFCRGDELLESMLLSGDISEIFTLSDFHTSYVTTCDHGSRRNFEVLKHKVFQTRNGVVNYFKEIDISAKDPFLCVYNASVTKGMIPLVTKIWPKIKAVIPQAKLKVIGGYYRFRENAEPDKQEQDWRNLVADPKYKSLDVEFTGIIKQNEIAEILSKASYMLHPGAFPETFGISSLEALTYNVPLVACRFGAMEETAVDMASYLIDYPIEPNGLFPNINSERQVELYSQMAIQAMKDKYLHQQKTYACNLVKDVCTWDTVALQWKQHFFKLFGLFLSAEDFRKVSRINNRIKKVFGRRFSNFEDNYILPTNPQQRILVITPVYNSEQYIARCIQSVLSQDYDNYQMVIINDASTDRTKQILDFFSKHPNLTIIHNDVNVGAVKNQIDAIRKYSKDDDIVMLLDGDDALVHDNQIFAYYNNLYDGTTEFSYGSCWSMVDKVPLIAQPYPEEVKQNKSYRQHLFNWNMPYTHLRTFKANLINKVEDTPFLDENGKWYRAGGDCAVFYTALESADPNKIKVVSDIVYNYNDLNPNNDYKINGDEQTKNANRILGKSDKEKFSVIIPTMWKYAKFPDFVSKLANTDLVGEILIINNDPANTLPIKYHDKIKMFNFDKNIYVNPAWNYGVSRAKFNKLCIANDDIEFDTKVFEKVYDFVVPEAGVSGLCPGETENWNQPPITDKSIQIIPWQGQHTFGFGSLMFLHKNNWVDIPADLKVYYGDNLIFDRQLKLNKTNYLITNMDHYTKWAQTTIDPNIVLPGTLEVETEVYKKVITQGLNTLGTQPKTILIAIPTNMGIKPETYKAIYDLVVPKGYITKFQYFYGYQIDQIRNLIAEWGKHFDYLFCVDSDISFSPDTLVKLLGHNKDIVAGIYIQRKPDQHTLEVYTNGKNTPYEEIVGKDLVEVEASGFGCILINSNVLRAMEYPHFVYKSAIDHAFTLSEDVYFCKKAAALGFKTYVDPNIVCDHHGDWIYKVNTNIKPINPITARFKELEYSDIFPRDHEQYLWDLKNSGEEPKIIYDIGSCVLHWTDRAEKIWPNAKIYQFEAMDEAEEFYKERNLNYYLGVLSDKDGKEVEFYQNNYHPGGNSYYKEDISKLTWPGELVFTEEHKRKKIAKTLDTVVREKGLPLPDMIKIDTQGAEMDILKGAQHTLSKCKHLILELQRVEFNVGAPLRDEVIKYVESLGFKLVKRFTNDGIVDADHHFVRV
jgi:FkbM family methyltransferase